MRIYMAGAMFTRAEVDFNLRMAATLRGLGFDVYCPNESEPINDKTRNDITGKVIYEFDIAELAASNICLLQVGEDSGSNWEAGYFDCLTRHVDPARYAGVIGLATDIRLLTAPDVGRAGVDNQAGYLNQLIVGGLQLSLGIYTDEPSLLARLVEIEAGQEG